MNSKVISPVNAEDRKKLGIKAGDTVRVWQRIKEGDKYRLQAFEGLVLSTKHGNEPGATFIVRRTAGGTGVEKIFPLYSPMIDKIEILKRAKVRRAKLYHIREKAAREIRRQMRNMQIVDISTSEETEEAEEEEISSDAAEEAKEEGETPKTPENSPGKEKDSEKSEDSLKEDSLKEEPKELEEGDQKGEKGTEEDKNKEESE